MTVFARLPSPLGRLLVIGEPLRPGEVVLSGLYFEDHLRGPAADPAWPEDPDAFAAVRAELDRYFAGGPIAFDLPFALPGTPFQREVWDALRRIPRGATATYADLAARVGRPRASRAVGAAVGANPISIVIPCHRAVGSDGRLHGYAGGLDRKRALLALEGAAVRG
jgi:methylated-DNA-[protein]-cysteine S-methyltransferase